MAKLSARAVETIAKPGMHADGGNLYLCVSKTGAKSWIFRWKKVGRVREMGLGALANVGLAAARRKAEEARKLIGDGVDPLDERKAEEQARRLDEAKRVTFRDAATALIASKESGWRNEKHRQQWRNTLTQYAYPVLGDVPVDDVDISLVLKVLEPLWLERPETASRLRGRIEAVLDWAKARGYRQGENPARWRGNLDHLLAKQQKLSRGHHAALPYTEVPAFLADLRTREGMAALALEFAVLTAARSGEVRGMTWAEVNLKEKVWTIPATRMKAGKEHRVPLTDRTIEIFKLVVPICAAGLVFPGTRGKPLPEVTLLAVLRRMGHDAATVHGFRSAFRDWCGDRTNFPREVAEAALAHVAGDETERAYRRSDALDKRRKLMEAWAAFCTTPPKEGSVIELAMVAKSKA
jgi:integrase